MPRSAFVFVSQPTALSADQTRARQWVYAELARHDLAPRTVGITDHAPKNPLSEVCLLAQHCSGGLVLGFRQIVAERVTLKPGTPHESTSADVAYPTPWNQLEAGVLFSMRRPLLVIREPGIGGGVFDPGAGDHYVNSIDPASVDDEASTEGLRATIASWSNDVWQHYRSAWDG